MWGLDGPVYNRLGLTFAAHDRLMFAVSRSNLQDNLELNAKGRLFAVASETMPVEVGAMAGVAWNTQPPIGVTDKESQAYVQLIANVLLFDRLAVGVVPTLLRNPRIRDTEAENAFVLGLEGQYYFNGTWSFLGEWAISEERPGLENDSGTFGVEIRTRGHFFKLLVTNQPRPNPTMFLGGTPYEFTDTESWRVGFNITRLLPF